MYKEKRRRAVIRAIPWGLWIGMFLGVVANLFGRETLTNTEQLAIFIGWTLAGIVFAAIYAYLPTTREAWLLEQRRQAANRTRLLRAVSHFRPIRVGSHVHKVIAEMLERSQLIGARVSAVFNDQLIIVSSEMSQEEAIALWEERIRGRSDKYRRSFRAKKWEKEAAAAQQNRQALFYGAMLVAPQMTRDEAVWQSWVENNQAGYGAATLRYAENWARFMQGRIGNGDTLEACAEEAADIADVEGITGFMYGAAVNVLASCWKYGEELRRWHNLKTQFGTEGEEANKSGGVLNPALLGIRIRG